MSNWIGEPKRLVVCAANKYGDLVILGARHYDSTMQRVLLELDNVHIYPDEKYGECIQGFIDNHGIFMTREEAFLVAKESGQLNVHRTKTGHSERALNELFSEDLY